jgi:hypothetical protein
MSERKGQKGNGKKGSGGSEHAWQATRAQAQALVVTIFRNQKLYNLILNENSFIQTTLACIQQPSK